MCLEAGFVDVEESRRDVPWIFEKRSDIAPFFQGLFGLAVDVPTVARALDRYFTIRERPGRCMVEWQLLYCSARKPASGAPG